MPEQPLIRDVQPTDREEWQDLWERYLVFYKANLPEDTTNFLWRRIFDDDDPVSCVVAEVDGVVVGITHYFPQPDTWETGPVCYLQDLFVDEALRGSGIGRSLILEVHRRCGENDWRLLLWQTAEDNTVARRLYDDLTGETNGFVGYQMDIAKRSSSDSPENTQ